MRTIVVIAVLAVGLAAASNLENFDTYQKHFKKEYRLFAYLFYYKSTSVTSLKRPFLLVLMLILTIIISYTFQSEKSMIWGKDHCSADLPFDRF